MSTTVPESQFIDRPNIVVFFTDQQRWDTTGIHGNPLGLTPAFDTLARRGAWVEHCFTPQPVCGPARASLQTGRYATSAGVHINGLPLPQDQPTLAGTLADVGYDTAYFGKWHLSGSENPHGPVPAELRAGYRRWLAADRLEMVSDNYRCVVYDENSREQTLPGYRCDAITDAAVRYLGEQSPDGDPFLCFISQLEPHQQNCRDDYQPPNAYTDLYRDRWLPGDLAETDEATREQIGGYLGMVRRLDECLSRVIDALISRDLIENTIVVFTSDHACHFKTRNSEYKRSCHDNSLRVPCAIAGPGFNGCGRLKGLFSLVDLAPSLIASAGVEVPASMQGVPMLESSASRDSIYAEISEQCVGRVVRTERWKYAVEGVDVDPKSPRAETYLESHLYDLYADPHEQNNLIHSTGFDEVRVELGDLMKQYLIANGEAEAIIASPVPST